MIESSTMLIIIKASGGLGIFLLGMIIMTNGLKAAVGDSIKNILLSFTKSPYSGAVSGTIMTSLLQSSSATIVAAVGFVGAGILGFSEALGIIFGANLGTTITGWIVVLFGFKLQLGTFVLPFILVGTLLKLFSKSNLADFGYAMAGFGLIFVGIMTIQSEVVGLERIISPYNISPDSWIGILKLLLVGMIFTMITQSSSAGVATTLTILYADMISFEQAAAIVIGMDVGTTITAAIATLGGNINVRRTGYSHVVFNIMTAIGGVFLIVPFVSICNYIDSSFIIENSEIALVLFHSTFNLIGVIIVLPFTKYFANFMKSIVKDDNKRYTSKLDDIYLNDPSISLNCALSSVKLEYRSLLEYTYKLISVDKKTFKDINIVQLKDSIDQTLVFVDKITLNHEDHHRVEYLISLVHLLDHIQRLYDRLVEDKYSTIMVLQTNEVKQMGDLLSKNILNILTCIENNQFNKALELSEETTKSFQQDVNNYRKIITKKVAIDELNMPQSKEYLRTIRWLYRVSIHINRINYYLKKSILISAS